MDNAKVLFSRMSLLQHLTRNKGRYALCLIVVGVGTIVFSNSVLRAQQIPHDIVIATDLRLATPTKCRKQVEEALLKKKILDSLIRSNLDSAGRGLNIIRGTARFGLGAEYDAICEMFRDHVPCVKLAFYCESLDRISPPLDNCVSKKNSCDSFGSAGCAAGDDQCCLKESQACRQPPFRP